MIGMGFISSVRHSTNIFHEKRDTSARLSHEILYKGACSLEVNSTILYVVFAGACWSNSCLVLRSYHVSHVLRASSTYLKKHSLLAQSSK